VYADTMKKRIKNKNKTVIGPESVDDETDYDKRTRRREKFWPW
jgi:hypothetical protein